MVYTVTFNPAIDYVVHTGEMKLGSTNRSDREEMYFGGKGINVSVVLRELDIQSKALGFTAGFTGEAIENGLAEMGIDTDFVHLKNGNSRINVKIKSAEETELMLKLLKISLVFPKGIVCIECYYFYFIFHTLSVLLLLSIFAANISN